MGTGCEQHLSAGIQQEMQPPRGTGLCRELRAPENHLIDLLKKGAMLGTQWNNSNYI